MSQTNLLIFLFSALILIALVHLFRGPLVKYLTKLRGKLHIQSLRDAIGAADKDKAKTGRKNMVVLNSTSGQFESVQKRQLKILTGSRKNKSNASMTKHRKKRGGMVLTQSRKEKILAGSDIKTIQQKSLYVTN